MEVRREVKREGCHGSHGAELRLNGGLIDDEQSVNGAREK
jgi:hypothetical protein